jgi:uncharacterized protein
MFRRTMLASLVILAGCTSPNPALYTLAIVPGVAQPGGPRLVVLHEIGVARYLERSQIVRSSEDYRLNIQSNDWWGEPPGAMLNRVLVQEIAQRLPGTDVFSEIGAISTEADATVEVNVQRMDAGRDGALILVGQVAVSGLRGAHATRTRMVRLSVPLAGTDTRSAVAAMSVAVGQLADIIASMLRVR